MRLQNGILRAVLAGALLAVLSGASCARRLAAEGAPAVVPDSSGRPVALARPPVPSPPAVPGLPESLLARASSLTLADVVDVALQNSPTTRETWANAQSAYAQLGETRSAYYPELDLTANLSRSKQAAVGGRFISQTTVYGPTVSLTYLLLDFGGRRGDAQESLERLHAADWLHNTAIQNVALDVQIAYYDYLDAKAQLAAAGSTQKALETNLEAATDRKRAGVATVADVLQSKTALSQAELNRQFFEGRVKTSVGALATAMGLPANTSIDVGALPGEPPIEEVGEAVERLIAKALEERPDLAAARSEVLAEEGSLLSARAARRPTFTLLGSVNRSYYRPTTFASYADNWSAAVLFNVPLFDGYARSYAIKKAEADRDAAQARSDARSQQAVFEVWRSYYDLQTAAKRIRTSRDLLASAGESEQVALARYKEGVGSILDLLTAESSLALARAQEIESRSDWFIAVARLAHDTGSIGPLPAALPSGGSDGR
jgi:outer membrane protein